MCRTKKQKKLYKLFLSDKMIVVQKLFGNSKRTYRQFSLFNFTTLFMSICLL